MLDLTIIETQKRLEWVIADNITAKIELESEK